MRIFLTSLCLLLSWSFTNAQVGFRPTTLVPVTVAGENLPYPWAGGLNSPQFSTVDADGDRQQDLFVFERTTGHSQIWRWQENRWRLAPSYTFGLPALRGWALFRDGDGDGQKDLFTPTTFGIRVLQHTRSPLRLQEWLGPIQTIGRTGNAINLSVDITDLPALGDFDDDGDLDVVNFAPSTGGVMEFHKNLAVENYNRTDTLALAKIGFRWGNFDECGCNSYAFGAGNCRIEHAGSTVSVEDVNGDGIRDLILGDVDCPNLNFLPNRGENFEQAKFENFVLFPEINPIELPTFPAAFWIDVDKDGDKDLISAHNTFANEGDIQDFRQGVWVHKNNGGNDLQNLASTPELFLQDGMIDIGENARPALADIDQDGDKDLILGGRGYLKDGAFAASLFYFENTGNDAQPQFVQREEDFLELFAEGYTQLKPGFADLNGDQLPDLYFTAWDAAQRQVVAGFLPHRGQAQTPYAWDDFTPFALENLRTFDELFFAELSGDDLPDLLVGRYFGGVTYYENQGNLNFILKQENALGIEDNTLRRQRSLWLDEDRLITANAEGQLEAYDGVREALASGANVSPSLLPFFGSENRRQFPFLGNPLFPATYGDFLLVGTGAGGVMLFQESEINALEVEEKPQKIQVYPNPNSGVFRVVLPEAGRLRVCDALGKTYREKDYDAGVKHLALKLSPGLYLLHFQAEEKWYETQKIIVR